MMEYETVRSEAEGYVMLGLHEEAWELVESLPVERRITPEMLRVRLACAMASKRFDMAQELAQYLAQTSEADAPFAGRVLHELAAIQYLSGEVALARQLIASAVAAYPAQQVSIDQDPCLKPLAEEGGDR